MSAPDRDGILASLPGGSPRSLLDDLARVGTALARAGRSRPEVEIYLSTGPLIRGRVIGVADERGGAIARVHVGGQPQAPSIAYIRADQIVALTVTDASLLFAAPLSEVPVVGRLDLQHQLATRAEAVAKVLGRPFPITCATDLDDAGRRAVSALLPVLADVLTAIAADDMGKEALASFHSLELGAAPAVEVFQGGAHQLVLRAPTLLAAQLDHVKLRAAIEKLL